MMIKRPQHLKELNRLLSHNPVVALLGARQVGKTTLARELARLRKSPTHFFDLESTADLSRLSDPLLALSSLRGLVVLDEVQRRPDLFPTLRVLSDRPRRPARFLVLGSASPELLRQSSETLAGRIVYYQLPPFSLSEIGESKADLLWLRGGFPRSFTAHSHRQSYEWRRFFIRDFLERDIPQLGIRIPTATLDRFWSMLAHYHAQIWNGSELARAFGVSHHAVRNYLDVLEATFMVRTLKPWSANIGKRQVKSPKIYIRDSGILHNLLNVATHAELERHPKVGASWEGFIVETLIRALGVEDRQCYFWATHSGPEIDLVVHQGGRLRGFEIKRTTAPAFTRSMRSALRDLGLTRIDIIHAGTESFTLDKQVHAIAAKQLLQNVP